MSNKTYVIQVRNAGDEQRIVVHGRLTFTTHQSPPYDLEVELTNKQVDSLRKHGLSVKEKNT